MVNGFTSEKYQAENWALMDIISLLTDTAPLRVDNTKNPTYSELTPFGNRLFNRRDTNVHAEVEITDFMDPKHTLRQKATMAGLVHTTENAVMFLKRARSG